MRASREEYSIKYSHFNYKNRIFNIFFFLLQDIVVYRFPEFDEFSKYINFKCIII